MKTLDILNNESLMSRSINGVGDMTDVDGIALTELVGIISDVGSDIITPGITIGELLDNPYVQQRIQNAANNDLYERMRSHPRYRNIRMDKPLIQSKPYTDTTGHTYTSEFKAMTFILPDGTIIPAYAGTGALAESWNEDLRMGATKDGIGAQVRATEYLQRVAAAYPDGNIYIAGYSKGCNLAMYAGVYADYDMSTIGQVVPNRLYSGENSINARIKGGFLYEGPGFNDELMKDDIFSEGLRDLMSRPGIRLALADNSIVGQLLNDHDYVDIRFKTNVEHNEGENALGAVFIELFGNHMCTNWEFNEDGSFLEADETLRSSSIDSSIDFILADFTPYEITKLSDHFSNIISLLGITNIQEFSNLSDQQKQLIVAYLLSLEPSDILLIAKFLDRIFSIEMVETLAVDTVLYGVDKFVQSEFIQNIKNGLINIGKAFAESTIGKILISLVSGLIIGSGIGAVCGFLCDKAEELFKACKNGLEMLDTVLEKAKEGLLRLRDLFFDALSKALKAVIGAVMKAGGFVVDCFKGIVNKIKATVNTMAWNFSFEVTKISAGVLAAATGIGSSVSAAPHVSSSGGGSSHGGERVIVNPNQLKRSASDLRTVQNNLNNINSRLSSLMSSLSNTKVKDSSGKETNQSYKDKNHISSSDLRISSINRLGFAAELIERKANMINKLESEMKS